MRKKDDAKKELILNYIHEYYGRFGKTPVVLEIASGTAISSATVHRYLVAMNESGELNYTGKGSIHTPKIEKSVLVYICPSSAVSPVAPVIMRKKILSSIFAFRNRWLVKVSFLL